MEDFDKIQEELDNELNSIDAPPPTGKPRKERVYIIKTVEKIVEVKKDRTKLPTTTNSKPLF